MKIIHLILISDYWEKYHRKEYTKEFIKEASSWSESIIVQLPVSLFVHLFTNFKRLIKYLTGSNKICIIENNTILFTPFIFFHYLLWEKNSLYFKIDFIILNYQLKKIIKRHYGECKILLWVYFPFLFKFAEKFKKDFIIYDQYDIHHMDINNNINYLLKILNDKLIKKSNLVFCTTKYLYDISKKINNCSYYITNGNNYDLLIKTEKAAVKINLPIKSAKTIGYLGSIRDWIDFELLNFIISKKKDVNFLFIGIIYSTAARDMKKIMSYENVKWINYVQSEYLSSYLSTFNAGIIPFKTTEFFNSVFPNKFFEYLACKIPVITTNLPELKKFDSLIGYSHNQNEFLENCESALKGNYDKYLDSYIKISKENSWHEKAVIISNIIQKSLI